MENSKTVAQTFLGETAHFGFCPLKIGGKLKWKNIKNSGQPSAQQRLDQNLFSSKCPL